MTKHSATTTAHHDVRRRAGWLPADQDGLEGWLRGRLDQVRSREDGDIRHRSVAAFRDLVESDPILRMHAHQMIAQVPTGREYRERHLQSVDEMFRLIDDVLGTAPEYGQQMVMTPVDGVLDWAKATPAGFSFFRDRRVNDAIRAVLDEWSAFLSSPASLGVLNDSDTGWKSESAQEAVGMDQYRHDPADEHWGFSSWNDFFTRRFRDGERPVASPDDDGVVVSPVEATPYRIAHSVRRQDEFWIKGEPYSLDDMLAGDPAAATFEGGTVFQAFLSALNYHRWHSPVSGTVVRAEVVPGTYYSESDAQGVGSGAAQPTHSQGYMAHVATRAILHIEADDPALGLVAVLFIGMSDVSSCIIGDETTVGAHVAKGQELGYFQYGGSTSCTVFRPGAIESFALDALPQAPDEQPTLLHVRSHLATARRSSDA